MALAYQCTPGTNRIARLMGLGTRTLATALAGRRGRRDGVRGVSSASMPRAAAESG